MMLVWSSDPFRFRGIAVGDKGGVCGSESRISEITTVRLDQTSILAINYIAPGGDDEPSDSFLMSVSTSS